MNENKTILPETIKTKKFSNNWRIEWTWYVHYNRQYDNFQNLLRKKCRKITFSSSLFTWKIFNKISSNPPLNLRHSLEGVIPPWKFSSCQSPYLPIFPKSPNPNPYPPKFKGVDTMRPVTLLLDSVSDIYFSQN